MQFRSSNFSTITEWHPASSELTIPVLNEFGQLEEMGFGDEILSGHVIVLGGPGTGKTNFMLQLASECRKKYPDARFVFLDVILLRSNSSLDECEWIVYYDLILPNYDLDESVTIFEKAIHTGTIPKMTFNVEEYKHRMKHLIYLLSD